MREITIVYSNTGELGNCRHLALFLAFKYSNRNYFRNIFAWSAVGLVQILVFPAYIYCSTCNSIFVVIGH